MPLYPYTLAGTGTLAGAGQKMVPALPVEALAQAGIKKPMFSIVALLY